MIVGIGLDLVNAGRIDAAIERHGERFLNRLFTETERREAARRGRLGYHAAGQWAAKEALVKALGTGFTQGVTRDQIEIGRDKAGRPVIHLSGAAQDQAQRLGVARIHASITHDTGWAAAQVILEA